MSSPLAAATPRSQNKAAASRDTVSRARADFSLSTSIRESTPSLSLSDKSRLSLSDIPVKGDRGRHRPVGSRHLLPGPRS